MRLGQIFFILFLLVRPLLAEQSFRAGQDSQRPTTISPALGQGVSEIRYNQIKTPQFLFEEILPEASILNGGLGNGRGGNPDPSYFCSGQDEVIAYRRQMGLGGAEEFNPNVGAGNQGSYRVARIIDRCRTEGGCGSVPADGKSFLIGSPKYATNCHPWGEGRFWDNTALQSPSVRENSFSTPPNNPLHFRWSWRNYIDDGKSLLFGRYLFHQLAENLTGDRLRTEAVNRLSLRMNATNRYGRDEADPYLVYATPPQFLDIPYSLDHLTWGFTCAEIARNGGYQSNPVFRGRSWAATGRDQAMDVEWLDHHRTLLEFVRDDLGSRIARRDFGNIYPRVPGDVRNGLTVNERGIAEIVVNIWTILNKMLSRVEWGACTDATCRARQRFRSLFGLRRIEIRSCRELAGGSLVDYRHEERLLCVKSEIASDCHSKRAKEADSHYNVHGEGLWGAAGRCFLSYGEWRGGGIYERAYETAQGYQLRDRGETIGAIHGNVGYRSPDGYSPVIASLIAHQLVHAYFQRELEMNRMIGWPNNPEALYEEELAVMAQAAVFTHLRWMGYADKTFKMEKEGFIRSITRATPGNRNSRVVDATMGERFLYPQGCRGYGGIFLGPFCANMRSIYSALRNERNPELARMLALYHAKGPTLTPPARMMVNGQDQAFRLASDQAEVIQPDAGRMQQMREGEQRMQDSSPTPEEMSDDPQPFRFEGDVE
ncbi:MAG: hypothetical protein HYT77_01430 [Deltaproteobacteria bacterium]|nr:hypothetical protein [Deltaproteobacteria bacterium]